MPWLRDGTGGGHRTGLFLARTWLLRCCSVMAACRALPVLAAPGPAGASLPGLAAGAAPCASEPSFILAPDSRYIAITQFGAKADGVTDNRAAIQAAFTYAAFHRRAVFVPPGNFAYAGTLRAADINVFGAGEASKLLALTADREAVILTGNGASLSDLTLHSPGTSRRSDPQGEMVWVQNATRFTVRRLRIEGGSTGGIMSDGSHRGRICGNRVVATLADGITAIHGSSEIAITDNRVVDAGDDGISVVSYVDAPIVHNIRIQRNTVLHNLSGRGITDVGGNNIEIVSNHVEGGPAGVANVYVAAEAQWATQGADTVIVGGNTLMTGGGTPAGTGQGAVTVYNSQGRSFSLTNIKLVGNLIVAPVGPAFQFVGTGHEEVVAEDNLVVVGNTPLVSRGNPAAMVVFRRNHVLTALPLPEGVDKKPRLPADP